MNFYDGHDREKETGVNADCSALLQMHHLPYSVRDSLSNHKDPSSLLLDELSMGFKEMMRSKAVERNEGSWGVKEDVTDVLPFERKLNKYLISQRFSAPWR